jgi:hypothetical protein
VVSWETRGSDVFNFVCVFDSDGLVVFSFGTRPFFSLSFLLDFLELVDFFDCLVSGVLGLRGLVVSFVGVLKTSDCRLDAVSCVGLWSGSAWHVCSMKKAG